MQKQENKQILLGASLPDSSIFMAKNIKNEDLLKQCFKPFKIIRITIGPSDYSPYIYDVRENNKKFDKEEKIPFLKKLLRLKPDLQILAVPSHAPMYFRKQNTINDDLIEEYAQFLFEFVQFYQQNEINIQFICVQDEPMKYSNEIPTMVLSPQQNAQLIYEYIKISQNQQKILVFDHNPDEQGLEYCFQLIKYLKQYNIEQQIAGFSFHNFGGEPENIKNITDLGYKVYHTSSLSSKYDTQSPAIWQKQQLIRYIKTGSESYIYWTMFLDENSGPVIGSYRDALPLIICKQNGQIEFTDNFYLFQDLKDKNREEIENMQL